MVWKTTALSRNIVLLRIYSMISEILECYNTFFPNYFLISGKRDHIDRLKAAGPLFIKKTETHVVIDTNP